MNAASESTGKTVRVKQIRSSIGFERSQGATLRAMGLTRIGRVRELPDNAAVRGMIAKVAHLVEVVGD